MKCESTAERIDERNEKNILFTIGGYAFRDFCFLRRQHCCIQRCADGRKTGKLSDYTFLVEGSFYMGFDESTKEPTGITYSPYLFVLSSVWYNDAKDDPTGGEYRYSGYYYTEGDADSLLYCFPKDKVAQQLYEVFGAEDTTLPTDGIDYNAVLNRYESGLEFGFGNSYSCYDPESEANLASQTVKIAFELKGSRNYPDTGSYGQYTAFYSICDGDDVDWYLRLIDIEKA